MFLLTFWTVWIAAMLLAAFAAIQIVRCRLERRYPALLIFLSLCVIKSVILFANRHNPTGYRAITHAAAPIMSVLLAVCLAEAAYRLTDRFPRPFVRVRIIMLAVCSAIAAVGVYATSEAWTSGHWSDGIVRWAEFANAALAVTLLLFAAPLVILSRFLRTVPITNTAICNALVLPLYFGGQALSVAIARDGDPWMVASWVAVGSGVIAGAMWTFCMTAKCDQPGGTLAVDDDEYRRVMRGIRHRLKLGKISSSQGWLRA